MKIEINIQDDKIDEFLETCDEIIAQNKNTNRRAWALAINLKNCAKKAIQSY